MRGWRGGWRCGFWGGGGGCEGFISWGGGGGGVGWGVSAVRDFDGVWLMVDGW